jgi:hypothetical protein
MFPTLSTDVFPERDHPGLLLDVNVEVVTLDVRVRQGGFATF